MHNMIEVYEINGLRAIDCAKMFGVELNAAERVFVMHEDGDIGAGVLQLDKGVVIIKHIITDKPFLYFDLLVRSMLAAVRDMRGIKIRIKMDSVKAGQIGINPEKDGYFLKFGFTKQGDFLEVLSSDINLSGNCKK